MSLELLNEVKVPKDFNLPKEITASELLEDAKLYEKAKELILKNKVCFLAHYYTAPIVQKLCEETGGFIGDSLEMARVGRDCKEQTVLVAGVRFMGQTAKILSKEKTVLMPDLNAECSLDLCCTKEDLKAQKELHKDAVVVAYANTSVEVKALADWIVTSSMAVSLGKYLASLGKEVLWVPDRYLGSYIENESKAHVYSWPGKCIVHDSFSLDDILKVKKEHPEALLLVHPEAPASVVAKADFVGSTSQILAFAKQSSKKEFIIATEHNISYKLNQACKDKVFIEAPVKKTESYNRAKPSCPWMELNTLAKIVEALEKPQDHEIFVDEELRVASLKPLEKMLNFAQDLKSGKIVL